MNCFNSLITIDGECAATEGISVAQLPYVTLKTGSKLLEEYDGSLNDFYQKIIDDASLFVQADFKAQIKHNFRTGRVLVRKDLLKFNECEDVVANDGLFKGYLIESKSNSKTKIDVNTINVWTESNVTIKVYDAIDGSELHSQDVTAATKKQSVRIGESFKTESIIIGFIQTGDVYPPQIGIGCGCANTSLRPIQTSGTSYKECDVDGGVSMFGIDYSITCDMDAYLCEFANEFTMPMLYRFGMLLFQQAKVSERINETIVKFTDDTIYEYYESEYMRYMKSIVDGYQMPCDECFTSNSSISVVPTLQ